MTITARFEVKTVDAQGEILVRSTWCFPSAANQQFDRMCNVWKGYRTQLVCIVNGRVMRDTAPQPIKRRIYR